MKEEELYTILLFGSLLAVYLVPTIILAILHKGAWEYVIALTIFIIIGRIFWHGGAVLRQDKP